MTTSKRRTTKGCQKQEPGTPVVPLVPPLIILVGGAVIHALPAGCTLMRAPLLEETLIEAALLAGNQAPAVQIAVDRATAIQTVYAAMRDRQLNPSGDFDGQGRWYPSTAQEAGGMTVISPTRWHPYAYLIACRTRKHTRRAAEASPELFLAQVETAFQKQFPISTAEQRVIS